MTAIGPADPLWLGLDAGSSVVKAALFDARGREVASAGHPMGAVKPHPGWSEVPMQAAWDATVASIRAVLDRAPDAASRVAGIGVTGCMVGAWPIDAAGRPVRNGILWNDGRAQDLIDRLIDRHPGLLADVFAADGCVLQQGCTLPVVAWLAEAEPDALARTAAILGTKDWIRYRLTGRVAIDETETAVAPGDTRTRRHDPGLLALFGLDAHARRFPAVRPSAALAGTVTAVAARQTGLRAGTAVAIGAGDVPASTLGVGASAPGRGCVILGTTCLVGSVVPEPVFEPPEVGLLFALPNGRWLRTMTNVAGTTNLDWALARLLPDAGGDRFAAAERLAAPVAPGARGLVYLPYLSEVGVIAPFVDWNARGELFGLTDRHAAADLVRAVYEGVALSIRDCLSAMPNRPDRLRLAGGGARSPLWCRIIADVTGCAIEVPAGSEFGARGAALLAAVATGRYADVDAAVAATDRLDRTYAPDPSTAPAYDRAYATYKALRQALRPVWAQAGGRPD